MHLLVVWLVLVVWARPFGTTSGAAMIALLPSMPTRWLVAVCTAAFAFTASVAAPQADLDLYKAAGEGDLAGVEAALQDNANMNYVSGDGWTPLSFAILHHHADYEEIVRLLLKRGAHADFRDTRGRTPLFFAVKYGLRNIVTELFNAGVKNMNPHDGEGATAVLHATRRGDVETVKDLIKRGADINRPDLKGETPVKAAMAVDDEDLRAIFGITESGWDSSKGLAAELAAGKGASEESENQGPSPKDEL